MTILLSLWEASLVDASFRIALVTAAQLLANVANRLRRGGTSRRARVALIGAALLAAPSGCGGTPPPATGHAARALPAGPVVWLRSSAADAQFPLLRRNAAAIAVVHPAGVHPVTLDRVTADPGLSRLTAAVKAANPRALVVPAVVDDALARTPGGSQEMRRLLLDQHDGVPGDFMKHHVSQLVDLAKPYDGLAVDYEFTFDELRGDVQQLRAGFTVFTRALRQALPAGQVLAVAVRARTQVAPASPAQAAYDYRSLGRVADLVEVLAYDHAWPTSPPGAIAPPDWVGSVAAYTRTQLAGTGAQGVLLIGNYGYDWPVDDHGDRTAAAAALTATALTGLPGFSRHAAQWTYTRRGQMHVVHQITLAAMRHEVRAIAALRRLRVGFWSASESDPQGWAKITAALR